MTAHRLSECDSQVQDHNHQGAMGDSEVYAVRRDSSL